MKKWWIRIAAALAVMTMASAAWSARVYPVGVAASGEYPPHVAAHAIDLDPNTIWNAGGFGYQWIQLDLGSEMPVSSVRLLTGQWPAGNTSHRVFGRSTGGEFIVNFGEPSGYTDDYQWITLPGSSTPVRYIYIDTSESPSWISWREIEVYAPDAPTVPGAQFLGQSVPSSMQSGVSYPVSVTMRNTGTTTWTSAAQYRLGSQSPTDNWTWGMNRVALPHSVGPGQDVTFSFTVLAPPPGTHVFQWQMVQEGVAWFGSASTAAYVSVTNTPQTVDMRNYFVPGSHLYRLSNGTSFGRYNFFYATPGDGFSNLYNSTFSLQRPGSVMLWQKVYASNPVGDPENINCTATYAHLLVGGGNDKSVVEVGDWLNGDANVSNAGGVCTSDFRALGYQTSTSFGLPASGLNWSGPGGLDGSGSAFIASSIFHQPTPGATYEYAGAGAYSSPVLVEVIGNWSPTFGRSGGAWVSNPGTVYTGVVRMVFYHGIAGSVTPCTGLDPANPLSSLYRNQPGYKSYAMEFYMNPTRGILQETLLYDETGFWGHAPCSAAFPAWSTNANLASTLASGWRWHID